MTTLPQKGYFWFAGLLKTPYGCMSDGIVCVISVMFAIVVVFGGKPKSLGNNLLVGI